MSANATTLRLFVYSFSGHTHEKTYNASRKLLPAATLRTLSITPPGGKGEVNKR